MAYDFKEIRDCAWKGASAVPIAELLSKRGREIVGSRYDEDIYQCPFCGEHENPSFSVNRVKNFFKCFHCDTKGGPAAFEEEMSKIEVLSDGFVHPISKSDASLLLAYKSGVISEREFSACAKKKPDLMARATIDTYTYGSIVAEPKAVEPEVLAPPAIRDLVYRHLLKFMPLSREKFEYLVTRRNLNAYDIRNVGFFAYEQKINLEQVFLSIRKEMPSFKASMLWGVPGFFFKYTDKTKTAGSWSFKAPYKDCLGIPLRNGVGQIVALQMRHLNQSPRIKNKYFYVSSKVSSKDSLMGFGSSPKCPVAVNYPSDYIDNSVFYIGEGMFKMMSVAKEHSVAMSVQGVQNYAGVADEVRSVMQSPLLLKKAAGLTGEQKVRFCIVYDMDMFSKVQVLEAGLKFACYLQEHFPDREVYFLIWNEALGKGYDDMKFHCLKHGIDYRHNLRTISAEKFLELVREGVKEADYAYLMSDCHKLDGFADDNVRIRLTDEWASFMWHTLYERRILPLLR